MKTKQNRIPKKAHDVCFRAYSKATSRMKELAAFILSRDDNIKAPPICLNTLDAQPTRLELPEDRWIDPDLRLHAELENSQGDAEIVFEFQSTIRKGMAERLLLIVALIKYEAQCKNNNGPSPTVITIVLSNAKRRWRKPADYWSLLMDETGANACRNGIASPRTCFLCDLQSMTNAEIVDLSVSASLRLFFLVSRNVRHREFVNMLDDWKDLWAKLRTEPDGLQVLWILLAYMAMVHKFNKATFSRVAKMSGISDVPVPPPGSLAAEWFAEQREEGIQHGLQKGREEGIQHGLQKGREEGIQHGLQKGREEGREEEARNTLLTLLDTRFGAVSATTRRRINNATLDDLRAWTRNFANAANLKSVFKRTPMHA
jgi:hypothetical protein